MADPSSRPKPSPSPSGAQGDGPGARNRRFPRAPVELSVKLKFGSVQEFLNATAEDLSVGGMFLRSQHFGPGGRLREVGQVLALQFDAGRERVVEGLGRVVRVVADEPGAVPGVGIEFVELDETSRRLIAAIVEIKLVRPFGG